MSRQQALPDSIRHQLDFSIAMQVWSILDHLSNQACKASDISTLFSKWHLNRNTCMNLVVKLARKAFAFGTRSPVVHKKAWLLII
jgi:hypothetical protein